MNYLFILANSSLKVEARALIIRISLLHYTPCSLGWVSSQDGIKWMQNGDSSSNAHIRLRPSMEGTLLSSTSNNCSEENTYGIGLNDWSMPGAILLARKI